MPAGDALNPLGRALIGRRAWISIVFAIGGLVTLLLSPLLLLLVSIVVPQADSYARLSAVGQSFTGISAVLSAFALGALAYTSRLQARQANISAIQAARAAQFELQDKAFTDPTLARVFGVDLNNTDFDTWKVGVYRNMWFMYMQMIFRTEELSEKGLRRLLSLEFFTTSEGVRFWRNSRMAFAEELTDLRGQRFVSIIDEEALKASALFARTDDAAPS